MEEWLQVAEKQGRVWVPGQLGLPALEGGPR